MPNRWINQLVFAILWPMGMVGVVYYAKDDEPLGLVIALVSYLLFGTYYFLIYWNLTKNLRSGDILLIHPNHSGRIRFENKAKTPFFVFILFIIAISLQTSENAFAMFFALPTVHFLILWLVSIVYYDLWYGLILTDKKVVNEKQTFRIDAINKITLQKNAELNIDHEHKLDEIKINLLNYRPDELPVFFNRLKKKTGLEINVLDK